MLYFYTCQRINRVKNKITKCTLIPPYKKLLSNTDAICVLTVFEKLTQC